ncbi:hypothetical protein EV121DRAFT_297628 [Schizophyllum commune]
MSPGVSRGEIFANRREMRRGSRGNPRWRPRHRERGERGGRRRGAPPVTREMRRRLYLLPRPVNISTRRFHVASSAPLDHFLEIQAPLSLKQRIFVRRARVPLALNVSLLCPSPHMRPPSLSFSFALACTTLLVLQFATLFELAAPPATPSIPVSTNFNTPRGLGADAHPSNVADVSAPPRTFLDAAWPLRR